MLSQKPANRLRFAIAASTASTAIIVWMFVGGLVTYAPGISAGAMQNIYLWRIQSYGAVLIVLQVVILGILIRTLRGQRDPL